MVTRLSKPFSERGRRGFQRMSNTNATDAKPQDMRFREWKWLVGLPNALDYEGGLLNAFSVGLQQSNARCDYMAITGNAHNAMSFIKVRTQFHASALITGNRVRAQRLRC